jgi:pimeloyl-ACP methyl ester carboxylesterase
VAGITRSIFAIGLFTMAVVWSEAPSVAARPQRNSTTTQAEELLLQSAGGAAQDCSRYRARSWLRKKLVCDDDLACYGLRLDDNWEKQSEEALIVVLVHGFNSSPRQNEALMEPIREAGLPCGTFAYPNDYTILSSAQLLSDELHRFRRQYPKRRVALVCHSMGSLVARACIENTLYDPGNVVRLIMIAPPTHGTVVAHFAVGTDLWEHWLSRSAGGPWRRMRDSVIDGLGEAADDLCPNSEFLRELNGRPLHPRVRYSIFLGTSACLKEAQAVWIRESVCDQIAKLPGGDASAERLSAILGDIDELVDGKGDGIVAVKRGRLDGVADTLVMPFGHVSVTGEPRDEVGRIVQQAVLERVQ